MILIDNLNFITERFPLLWQAIKPLEEQVFPAVEVVAAKNGSPTMMVKKDGKALYLHSSYNPEAEAQRFVAQFTTVEKYHHIFFFGVGLGYHIEALLRNYPSVQFTIYEPVPELLSTYLSTRPLSALPLKQLRNLYVEMAPANQPLLLKDFTDFTDGNVLFVVLPSYEQAFPELTKTFITNFQRMVAGKRTNLQATTVYQRKWTLNSIRNFKYLLKTPNVLQKKDQFKGMPALIVAAGPSLTDEIERIKEIKEQGLAYIFSAGSGLVPLLNNGIYPDAATSYDPNQFDGVYKQVFEKRIASLPLIFGSTVGISLQKYPGPMAHMLNSQDTVAPYYLQLKNGAASPKIYDSTTISVVLVQLLKYLGFDPIIFVGQNLAFRGDYRYAGGIPYYKPEVTDKWRSQAFLVEAEDGTEVYTTEDYNRMRLELEQVIADCEHGDFINTTKGGAKIGGTTFVPLEKLIKHHLTRRVVNAAWFPEATFDYDLDHLLQQEKMMDADYQQIGTVIGRLGKVFAALEGFGSGASAGQWQKQISRFDRELKKLTKNRFYQVYIQPGRRVELELIAKNLDGIRFEADSKTKGEQIVKNFRNLVHSLPQDFATLGQEYEALQRVITEVNTTSSGGEG